MILAVIVDSTTCKIYEYVPRPVATLTKLTEMIHDENKQKTSNLVSDKPGHYQGTGGARGSYAPPHDPKEVNIDRFIQMVVKTLTQIHNQQQYKNCLLVAPAPIEGLLLHHAHPPLKKFITAIIQKDAIHLTEHELLDFLKSHSK